MKRIRDEVFDPDGKIWFVGKRKYSENIIQILLGASALLSILITLGIVVILGKESLLFFKEVSIVEFFTSARWHPLIDEFGVLPLINSTLITSFIAMLVAAPLGLLVAIYLSEYAGERSRGVIKPILEVLAGIPSVVYGYFALTFMTPFLRVLFGQERVEIYNTASAGLVMGILILPLVISITEDALRAVPYSLREAAYGLGGSKIESCMTVIVPAAFSGISAALILGFSRAIGETMIVTLAAGAGPNFTFNPLEAAETLTGYIVRISGGDVSYNTMDYNSIFALGLLLFLITLGLNILSRYFVRTYQEEYE